MAAMEVAAHEEPPHPDHDFPDGAVLDGGKCASPHGFFHPTHIPLVDGKLHYEWRARDHRKGRYPAVVHSHARVHYPLPRLLAFDYWDVSYWGERRVLRTLHWPVLRRAWTCGCRGSGVRSLHGVSG